MEILSIHNGDKMLSIWYIEKLFTCNLDKDKLPIPNIDFFLSLAHVEKLSIFHKYKTFFPYEI